MRRLAADSCGGGGRRRRVDVEACQQPSPPVIDSAESLQLRRVISVLIRPVTAVWLQHCPFDIHTNAFDWKMHKHSLVTPVRFFKLLEMPQM